MCVFLQLSWLVLYLFFFSVQISLLVIIYSLFLFKYPWWQFTLFSLFKYPWWQFAKHSCLNLSPLPLCKLAADLKYSISGMHRLYAGCKIAQNAKKCTNYFRSLSNAEMLTAVQQACNAVEYQSEFRSCAFTLLSLAGCFTAWCPNIWVVGVEYWEGCCLHRRHWGR